MGELSKLRGLGKKTELQLNKIGIYSKDDLQKIGAIATYVKLGEPHLCFLYALTGALEDRNWLDVAQNNKTQLIIELDNYKNI
jgi:DNA transformation protein